MILPPNLIICPRLRVLVSNYSGEVGRCVQVLANQKLCPGRVPHHHR